MNNFIYENPTKVLFGKGVLANLAKEVSPFGNKVLLVYGQESIKKSGLYETIRMSLQEANIEVIDHGGVQGNPLLSHAREGVARAKSEKVDLVLAVGGGSVIDESKAIAAGALTDSDLWEFYAKREVITKALPLVSIVTLPATASEMNGFSVLTHDETLEKSAIGAPVVLNPKVSFLDPELTFSLSLKQTAFACADIISHLTECYLTTSASKLPVQDNLIEGIIRALLDAMEKIKRDPQDYEARANFMWCATLGWNGLCQAGIPNWGMPCHALEMPMSGVYNMAHGAGLSVITPSWMVSVKELHKERILQFGKNILSIETERVEEVSEGLKALYRTIGAPTTFAEGGVENPDIEKLTGLSYGSFKLRGIEGYTKEGIREIYEGAL